MAADKNEEEEEVQVKSLFELAAAGDLKGFEEEFAIFANKKAAPEDLPDTNARDWRGQSILEIAAVWGKAEAIEVIVSKGTADVDAQSAATGMTALHRAAMWGHADCVTQLLALGASTKLRTAGSSTMAPETALEMARRYNQVDISKLIVDAEEARRIEEAAEAQRLLDAENGGKDKRPGSKGRK